MAAVPTPGSLAIDTRSLQGLQTRAASDPKGAVREAAIHQHAQDPGAVADDAADRGQQHPLHR